MGFVERFVVKAHVHSDHLQSASSPRAA